MASLTHACSSGNVEAVRVLLKQGDLREGADDGDSLLSLAASAGYYELCQVDILLVFSVVVCVSACSGMSSVVFNQTVIGGM